MIDTAVIIVNWNGKKYLKDCLDSLRAQTYKNFKVVFVDNGSDDGSVAYVREKYPEADIKEISRNVGFAAGSNLGIRQALKQEEIGLIVVLNNDTKLDENYLAEIIACAKKHPDAGSIQPKVVNFFERDLIDCAGIYITRDGTAHNRGYGKSAKKYSEEKEIFGANGTASLFTRQALEKTELKSGEYFDKDYFAFYEDVDLAWRIRRMRLKSYYCPRALVFHVHSGTAGKASLLKAYYLHRNYFFTVIKNYPAGAMVRTVGKRFLSYVRLVLNVFEKEKRETEFTKGYGKGKVALVILKAWGSVIAGMPGILAKRRIIQKNGKAGGEQIKKWLKKYDATS